VTGITDKFSYTISNEAGVTATANVAVTVKAGSLSAKPYTKSVPADKRAVLDVIPNVKAPVGASLTIIDKTNGSNGEVAIANDGKSLVYNPKAGFSGTTDSFTYTVTDGKEKALGLVTVSVEQATLDAADDLNRTVRPGGNVKIPVIDNDRALGGAALTPMPGDAPKHGSLTFNLDKTITYTANGNAPVGEDSFTYKITDSSGNTDTAKVIVLITN